MSAIEKLHYNTVLYSLQGNTVTAGPRFACPVCSHVWQHNGQFQLVGGRADYNAQLMFLCPNCGQTFRLYVAIHHDVGHSSIFVSVEPIASDWWELDA